MPVPEPTRVPLFLDLRARPVLVVGGGPVGAAKARTFAEAGARVRLVATRLGPEARALAAELGVEAEERPFVEADVDGAFLVVSATDEPAAQRAVFEAAERRRRFVLAVDDPEHGSAFGASVLDRPPFVIAISSTGEAPALTRLLREVFERALPPDAWVRRARELRRRWKAERRPMASRFPELVRELLRLPDEG